MAVDMFLKIGTIEGEAKDPDHRDWIDLSSVSHGLTQPSTVRSAGGGAEAPLVQDLSIAKELDKSSPKLAEACCHGAIIPDATIEFVRTSADGTAPERYFEIKMHDVLVSSYQTGGSSGDVVPVDSISLNFGKIEMVYTPYDRGIPQPSVRFVCEPGAD